MTQILFRKMSCCLNMGEKFVSFLILFSLALISITEQRECFSKGECKESFPVTGSVLETQYECRKQCQSNLACTWFTYFQKTSYCQLYKNCFRLDEQSCTQCLSGEKECSAPELKCWITGKCQGDPYSTNSTQTSEECLELCKEDESCKWFTFDPHKQSCNLFTDCSNLLGCDDCISGNSKCDVNDKGNNYYYQTEQILNYMSFVPIFK